MLRYFFNTPKNRSQSAPEALLLIFQPKKENFGPQNGPKKLVDSGGGGLRRALDGPLGAQVGQDGLKNSPKTPQDPLHNPKCPQKPGPNTCFLSPNSENLCPRFLDNRKYFEARRPARSD